MDEEIQITVQVTVQVAKTFVTDDEDHWIEEQLEPWKDRLEKSIVAAAAKLGKIEGSDLDEISY